MQINTDYLETFYEVVASIEYALMAYNAGLNHLVETKGTGGKWELAQEITTEFEFIHRNNKWIEDGWMETLEDFVDTKINNLPTK